VGNEYNDRLEEIVNSFPRLEELHPFYADLVNVLYDKDVYKKALGHISAIKKVIKEVLSEHLRLMKYGDSLYRCKQLKISCFGRMTSAVAKLKPTLEYLEEVRQHIGRLPEINPAKRTLILCGLPNVGKSSLMKTLSNTKVEVQNYAFTTKNLFVGHFEENYIPFQLLDTPGLLDHSIKEMNGIELQTITALAHLKAVVVYLIDASESCGYTLESQIHLFEVLKPLLQMDIVVGLSKFDEISANGENGENGNYDVTKNNLPAKNADLLKNFLADKNFVCFSSKTGNNAEILRKEACNVLLKASVPLKLEKIDDKITRIDIQEPLKILPKGPNNLREEQIVTEKEKEREFNLNNYNSITKENRVKNEYVFDKKRIYQTKEEEKYDFVPEFLDGKNISDFVDKKALERAQQLKQEELERVYRKEYDLMTEEEKELIDEIRSEILKKKTVKETRSKKAMPRSIVEKITRKVGELQVAKKEKLLKKKRLPVPTDKNRRCERFYDKNPKHLFVNK